MIKDGVRVQMVTEFLGLGAKTTFLSEVTGTSSFHGESSKTKTYTTTDHTEISIPVPATKQLTIEFMRMVRDLEYKWKAIFELLGKYSVKWDHNQEIFEDVTTVLSNSKREVYEFGSWNYPDTDFFQVIRTGQYGNKKSRSKHEPGKAKSCEKTK